MNPSSGDPIKRIADHRITDRVQRVLDALVDGGLISAQDRDDLAAQPGDPT